MNSMEPSAFSLQPSALETPCLLDRPTRISTLADALLLPLTIFCAMLAVVMVVCACYAGIACAAVAHEARAVWRWLTHRIVCAWCSPQRRIGGNPMARRVSHSICPLCSARLEAEDMSPPSDPSYVPAEN